MHIEFDKPSAVERGRPSVMPRGSSELGILTGAAAIVPATVISGLIALVAAELAVGAATLAVAGVRGGDTAAIVEAGWARLAPAFAVLPLVQVVFGLHPGFGVGPVQRLRLHAMALAAFAATLVASLPGAGAETWTVLAVALVLQAAFGTTADYAGRAILARLRLWCEPAVILGNTPASRELVRRLASDPQLGYRPVAVLDDDPEQWGSHVDGVRVIGPTELLNDPASWRRACGGRSPIAFVAEPETNPGAVGDMVAHLPFRKVVYVPAALLGFRCHFIDPVDLDGTLGLALRNRLVERRNRVVKRLLDLAIAGTAGLLALPVMAVAALLIKLDSPGPVLFRQPRFGRHGREFRALKFRTMVLDADARLEQLLQSSPEARLEYHRYRKLRDDPRVTRVGRLLRKFSIDELPQLWNVLRGDMSVVGPRPYLPREQEAMAGADRTILLILPGITGLWQVSGRNRTDFQQRLALDQHYVHNWSVWLDLHIILKTLPAVLNTRNTS